MVQQQAKFLNDNLFRHVSVMSLTASVGLMAVFIVDFVDMVFVSMLGKAELAAAIRYAGAIFFTTSFSMVSGPVRRRQNRSSVKPDCSSFSTRADTISR